MGEHSAKTTKKSTMIVETHITYDRELRLDDEVDINLIYFSRDEKKLLYKGKLLLSSTSWVHDAPIANEKYSARFRHGGRLVPVLIEEINKRDYVILKEYERAVTIGQSAVIYRDNECLGGGIIKQLFQ